MTDVEFAHAGRDGGADAGLDSAMAPARRGNGGLSPTLSRPSYSACVYWPSV